jgi:hypothetical protein
VAQVHAMVGTTELTFMTADGKQDLALLVRCSRPTAPSLCGHI